MSYSIEHVEHGVIVRGPIPITEMCALIPTFEERGWDLLDGLISKHLKVTMVCTNREHGEAWRKELGLEEGWM